MSQLTVKEFQVLEAIDNSDYGCYLTDAVWTWDVVDNAPMSAKAVAGVIGSLVKKGLVEVSSIDNMILEGKLTDEDTIAMTEAGAQAYLQATGSTSVKLV